MAGQSNMLGMVSADQYPLNSEADKLIAYFWTIPDMNKTQPSSTRKGSTTWQHMHPHAGIFGPEVSFARIASKSMEGVGVFKYAASGYSLYYEWGMGGPYDDMNATYNMAASKLRVSGHSVNLRGLIWIQGESDGEDRVMARQYYFRLKTLITDFRAKRGVENLPVVLGVDEQHPFIERRQEILRAQQRLAREESCIIRVSMRGLPKVDHSHLTARGVDAYGKRIFSAWRKVAARKSCQ